MYVIIGGGGLLGRNVAGKLSASKHDVVVIEKRPEVCEYIYERLGVVAIKGSATEISTLKEAGVEKADVAVASMRSDADNLSLTVIANSFGVPRIYARMRDPSYKPVYERAGATDTIDVVELSATPLVYEIEEPEVSIVYTFKGGKGAIAIIKIPEKSPVTEKTVAQIASDDRFPSDCLINGVFRKEKDEFCVPRGNRKIYGGDEVFITASLESIRKAAKFLGIKGKIKI
jgi:trk system potassium uptake protein TrkA